MAAISAWISASVLSAAGAGGAAAARLFSLSAWEGAFSWSAPPLVVEGLDLEEDLDLGLARIWTWKPRPSVS
jgi:hypothetical protein